MLLWSINYVFIDEVEAVRAWLLLHLVFQDPLDLLIYCQRPNNASRELTLALRVYNYLVPDAVTNGVNEEIAQVQMRGG